MDLRQFPAATLRSAGASGNCTSFSASENVAAETGGPACGAVPNAGGAPGGSGLPVCAVEELRAAAPIRKLAEARVRNWRRDFVMAREQFSMTWAIRETILCHPIA